MKIFVPPLLLFSVPLCVFDGTFKPFHSPRLPCFCSVAFEENAGSCVPFPGILPFIAFKFYTDQIKVALLNGEESFS